MADYVWEDYLSGATTPPYKKFERPKQYNNLTSVLVPYQEYYYKKTKFDPNAYYPVVLSDDYVHNPRPEIANKYNEDTRKVYLNYSFDKYFIKNNFDMDEVPKISYPEFKGKTNREIANLLSERIAAVRDKYYKDDEVLGKIDPRVLVATAMIESRMDPNRVEKKDKGVVGIGLFQNTVSPTPDNLRKYKDMEYSIKDALRRYKEFYNIAKDQLAEYNLPLETLDNRKLAGLFATYNNRPADVKNKRLAVRAALNHPLYVVDNNTGNYITPRQTALGFYFYDAISDTNRRIAITPEDLRRVNKSRVFNITDEYTQKYGLPPAMDLSYDEYLQHLKSPITNYYNRANNPETLLQKWEKSRDPLEKYQSPLMGLKWKSQILQNFGGQ